MYFVTLSDFQKKIVFRRSLCMPYSILYTILFVGIFIERFFMIVYIWSTSLRCVGGLVIVDQ